MSHRPASPSHRRVDLSARALAELDDHRRRVAFDEDQRRIRDDWRAQVDALPSGRARTRFVTLTCPACARTVGVLPGSSAWCPCLPGRVEMVVV